MKSYNPISVDLRKKRREEKIKIKKPSLFLHTNSPGCPPPFAFFFFTIMFFIFFFFSLFYYLFSFPLFLPLDTWLNVSHSHKCTTCHAMCHPTPDVSKNVKFRLSRNLMKFNGEVRFIIQNIENARFSTELNVLPFFENLGFLGFHIFVNLYNSSIVAGGSNDNEWKNGWTTRSSSLNSKGLRPCCKSLPVEQPGRISW